MAAVRKTLKKRTSCNCFFISMTKCVARRSENSSSLISITICLCFLHQPWNNYWPFFINAKPENGVNQWRLMNIAQLVQHCTGIVEVMGSMFLFTATRVESAYDILTVKRLTVPISSRIVNTSKRAWVGCSPTPSPALMTGLRQCSATSCNM